MRTFYSLILVALALLSSCSKNEKSNTKNTNAAIQTKLDKVVQTSPHIAHFMGNVVLLQDGNVMYSSAFGYDDVSAQKASSLNSKYRLGSISKTYTAVLVFKAIEDKKLKLEQTVDLYFPNLKNAEKIRIADLLQHRSGIPNFTNDKQFFTNHTQYKSKQDMLAMIFNYDSDFVPNSQSDYSNTNYYLLACILEDVYETNFAALLQGKITSPLSLQDTYQGGKVNVTNNEAQSYRFTTQWTKLPETHMSITLGAGDMVSTATDLALFMDALFKEELISNEHLEMMKTINGAFGMGLSRYDLAGRVGYGHRGTIDGYRSTAIYFPDDKVTLTITSNSASDAINLLFVDLLKVYFDDPLTVVSKGELGKYIGTYISTKDSTDSAVFIRDDNTLVHVIQNEFKEPLTYKGQRQFLFEQMYGPSILFSFSEDGSKLTFEQGKFKGTYIKTSPNPH